MRSKRLVTFLVLPVLALGTLFYTSIQVSAVAKLSSNPSKLLQVIESPCYVLADNEHVTGSLANVDFLSRVDFLTGAETPIGHTGTTNVEAIAFQFSTGILFGANGGQMGTFNLATGTFSNLPNAVGSGTGDLGPLTMADIDGLAFDPTTGILYGTHRKSADDVLFQIDHVSGTIINDAFAGGFEYVPVVSMDVDPVFQDVDDIAIDPVDGQMYGILNRGGVGDWLVKIDKATGAATGVSQLGVDDMEGLSFDPSGMLMGTTGKDGPPETRDRLFRIDKNTGSTDVATSVALTAASDYEASDCLTAPPVVITPTPSPTPTFTPTPTEPTAVELLYFRVSEKSGNKVTLSWATASEIGTYGFTLYRSRDADLSKAIKVHSLAARGGNTMAAYEYSDTIPAAGMWWYWLEETQTQGRTRVIANTNTGFQIFVPVLMSKAQP